MKRRINFSLLKSCQQKAQKSPSLLQLELYQESYKQIEDLLFDITRPFHKICIHGYHPHFIIEAALAHRNRILQKQGIHPQVAADANADKNRPSSEKSQKSEKEAQLLKPQIKIMDYLDILKEPYDYLKIKKNDPLLQLQNQNSSSEKSNAESKNLSEAAKLEIVRLSDSDKWVSEENEFDLVISCLELNHTNNEQTLLQKYHRSLKPDGALLGCAMAEGTLNELHWCYLMAENERHGGLSPKVMNFPSLGGIGNILTSTHFNLAAVLGREYTLQFDSPLDIIKALQEIGESAHLRGRRKAVFKDLLISMYALYETEYHFQNEKREEKVFASLLLAPFIGWKYSQDQPKPLRRGQHGDSIDFIDELRKHDEDLQYYTISEESEEAELIDVGPGDNKKSKDNR